MKLQGAFDQGRSYLNVTSIHFTAYLTFLFIHQHDDFQILSFCFKIPVLFLGGVGVTAVKVLLNVEFRVTLNLVLGFLVNIFLSMFVFGCLWSSSVCGHPVRLIVYAGNTLDHWEPYSCSSEYMEYLAST